MAVRKTKAGLALKRWFKEDWKDQRTGKKCGRQKGEKRGTPYCRPFAVKTSNNYNIVYTLINKFHDSKELIIVIDLCYEDNETFHNNLTNLNELIHQKKFDQRDIWLMGFHPDDDVNELIDDGSFDEIVSEEYSLIFVQRLSKLQESANKLKKLGYYDNYYNRYDVEDIYKQRETYYRRLKWQ